MRTPLTLALAVFASLLASSCSLPSKQQWAQINQHGLLPVLIDGRESAVTANSAVKPSEQNAVKVQAATTPVVVRTPSATSVPGRAGYAYSPHTTPRKVVDVRGYQPGEEVRCPFTGEAFLVPAVAAAPSSSTLAVSRSRTEPRITEVVSTDRTVPGLVEVPDRLEPVETPSAPPSEPVAPAESPVTAPPSSSAPAPAVKARPQIPYGTRVAGRPGFVYSPYGTKTQLVDVAGTAPGVVVKCPYSNKVFRVPEMAGEEVKPAVAKPADAAGPVPAPAPAESTPAAPAIPGPSLGSPQQP